LGSNEGDLSRDLRKIGLATFGERRECLASFAGLQAFAKQRACPVDLSSDLVHVVHQRLVWLSEPAGRFVRASAAARARARKSATGTTALAKPQANALAASSGSPSANIAYARTSPIRAGSSQPRPLPEPAPD
jgi:hypothetical protein